jgi:8-oxo-dGTP pyrophosphatase MutT (NUDIX family)
VNLGETGLEAAIRGAREELSLSIDKKFTPIYLGGYNHKNARPGSVNDNYGCYAIKATSLDWRKEDFEIDDAKWIPIKEVAALLDHPDKRTKMGVTIIEGKTYPESNLRWARNYLNKRGLEIESHGDWNFFF